ncbi:MAG: hypothetical protein SGILL_001326, partial [Bacillariaceae sp.]
QLEQSSVRTIAIPPSAQAQRDMDQDNDDQDHEIHNTSEWDENPYEDDEPQMQATDDDETELMEEVVRSAWQNSTSYQDTLVPIEQSELQRRPSSRPSNFRP